MSFIIGFFLRSSEQMKEYNIHFHVYISFAQGTFILVVVVGAESKTKSVPSGTKNVRNQRVLQISPKLFQIKQKIHPENMES